jgi:hypothetical protein
MHLQPAPASSLVEDFEWARAALPPAARHTATQQRSLCLGVWPSSIAAFRLAAPLLLLMVVVQPHP